MANEFIARNGLIAQNNSTITGSLTVTQGITGSLLGSSSYALNSGNSITSLNTLTGSIQTLVTGSTGTDFSISSSGTVHTFNIPLDLRPQIILNDTRTTAAVTGTTLNTMLSSYLIPANTFASGDRLQFDYLGLKSTAVASGTFTINFNTVNALGGTKIAGLTGGAAGNKFYLGQRNMVFKSSTTLEVFTTALNNSYDLGVDNNSPTTITYDVTQAYYLTFSVIPVNASDSFTQSRFAITRYKSKNTI